MFEKFLFRSLIAAPLLIVLMLPTTASGQYTFGDWANDHGFDHGDAMPSEVWADNSSIDSLDGIGDFDWTTTPTWKLCLAAIRTADPSVLPLWRGSPIC